MDLYEFLQNFFISLLIFYLLHKVFSKKAELTSPDNFAKINGKLVDLKKSVIAEAELVTSKDTDLWLVYDKITSKFLTQGLTPEICMENLKKQYPEKDIYILGLPK